MSAGLRFLSTVLMLAGLLLTLDAGVTLVWQEPLSAVYAQVRQDGLSSDLERREAQRPDGVERRALARLADDRRRLAFLARRTRRKAEEGEALGRLRIPRLDGDHVIVAGTNPGDLRKGPGHYSDTSLPGSRGTVAIAGHRTTYGAPFRRVDELDRGDDVQVVMPYGRFTYEVEATRIVPPDAVWVTRPAGHDRLVLTACHPLYSAAQRIVVFARLVRTEPRAAARTVPATGAGSTRPRGVSS